MAVGAPPVLPTLAVSPRTVHHRQRHRLRCYTGVLQEAYSTLPPYARADHNQQRAGVGLQRCRDVTDALQHDPTAIPTPQTPATSRASSARGRRGERAWAISSTSTRTLRRMASHREARACCKRQSGRLKAALPHAASRAAVRSHWPLPYAASPTRGDASRTAWRPGARLSRRMGSHLPRFFGTLFAPLCHYKQSSTAEKLGYQAQGYPDVYVQQSADPTAALERGVGCADATTGARREASAPGAALMAGYRRRTSSPPAPLEQGRGTAPSVM